jgi:DNA-binding transcriptional LysR family regulator
MLEAHVGYKLFNRKSKGVEPTEYAKLLNNLIIEALDRLENVENGFRAKALNTNSLISVGISKHLFSSIGVLYFQNLIILILVFMKKYFLNW